MLALLTPVLLWMPGGAAAQESLSEHDVVRLAQSQSPMLAVTAATQELADARARTAGLFPNPSLSWTREVIETGPVGSEDVVVAALPIDIARPLTLRSLAASENAWLRAEASLARTNVVLEALLAYYAVYFVERRVEVLTRSVADLDEAARILERREAIGTASGYESTRLTIAGELSRSQLAEAQSSVLSAKRRLATLLGVQPESVRVPSSLSFMSSGEDAALARRVPASRTAMRQARAAQHRALQAEQRARWTWLPTVELAGGVKRVSELGGGYGYVVGVTVGVPVFDRGQGLRAEAGAVTALAAARSDALSRSMQAEAQSELARFRAARRELERFETLTSQQVERLLVAAESGYREGERSIVELLDAKRAQTEVAERRLALLELAKRAEVRFRAAAGHLQ